MQTKRTQKQPLVSIIMPVYNAAAFLAAAIDSILKQTYENFELIIVDDASTDASWKIIQKYTKRYPKKIHAYQTVKQTNAAGNGAMNYGFQFAKGAFIARMDADDIAHSKRIEKQVAYLLAHPNTIVLGTQAKVIDKKGKVIGHKVMPTSHNEIYRQYGIFHPMVHPSVMINKKLLPKQKGIYCMKFDVNDDYYTFFKLLQYGKFANLPQYLLNYRVHGKNLSLKNPKQKFIASVKIRFAAMRDFDYQISALALLLMLAQILIILPIPESMIVPLYMRVRGIKKAKFTAIKVALPALPLPKKYATLPA